MRLRLRHTIVSRYAPAASSVIGVLRLTPRSHYGQHVIDWNIDVSVDCRLRPCEDAFGNMTHGFQIAGPLETVTVEASGEVELFDSTGFVRDAIERFPEELYLRDTPATASDAALRALADEIGATHETPLSHMHALMGAIHAHMKLEPQAKPSDTAAAAFAAGKGAAPDLAHAFIACARHMGLPARYVSGFAVDGAEAGPDAHGWAEVHIAEYGWIGFDPSLNICPCGAHLRLAMGLDLLAAAPLRGARVGYGDDETTAHTAISKAGFGQEQ